jgi:hypothetical protein
MKTLVLVLGALCLSLPAFSEDLKADLAHANAVTAQDTAIRLHRNIMQRIFGMNVSYSGALVPKSKSRKLPFSMAGSEPRAGAAPFENVSIHPLTGRAEGINLLSINF